jgi:hypothetical protein
MELENPDTVDLAIGRLFLSLRNSLDRKTQLLPYLRKQILDDTEHFFQTLTDDEVREYLKSLR